MSHPVPASLSPIVLLVAIGFLAGRRGWIGAPAVKDLSNLVFVVLTPALLFRTMSGVRVQQLDFAPIGTYFLAVALIFFATLALRGLNRHAAVVALANTFSNTVMIGTPLVGLVYGEAGLVPLFTLISVHALVLLTVATVVLELAVVREQRAAGETAGRHIAHTVLLAVRNAVIHPVPLPILGGLLFAQTGWALPAVVEKPLQLLGNAFGPLALLLVGVTLSGTRIGPFWKGALGLAAVKNLVHPAAVAAVGWALGLQGVTFGVMVLAAALPIGANVFLFSQRYQVAQELVTAGVGLSTLLGLASLPLVLLLLGN